MKRLLLLLISFVCVVHTNAQSDNAPKKKHDQKKEQMQIDEQLASQYFWSQDYASAQGIYKKLYEQSGQYHFFQQFIDCAIQLKQYKEAEKELKAFTKKNPGHSKAQVDLIYVYTLDGKDDKANKLFNDILKPA